MAPNSLYKGRAAHTFQLCHLPASISLHLVLFRSHSLTFDMPGMQNLDSNETAIACFEDMTRNAAPVQNDVLKSILHRNANTEYLQRHGLNGRTDDVSFRNHLPLVTHSDLHPYLTRIADGDTSAILTADPVVALSLSSGTTSDGRQKYLLLYKEILEATVQLSRIGSAYRAREFPIKPGGRFVNLVFSGKLSVSGGGLTSGTATTHLFRSDEYKLMQTSTTNRACSPPEVIHAIDNRQAMYCHLLCALLYCEEVEYMTSTFAYTLVEAFRTFELQWKNLCEDLRQGRLSAWIIDPLIRSAMSTLLRPDAKLADLILEKCSGLNDWFGVIPEIWPNCKYVLSIITGSMELYVKRLQHYAGKLPLISADYGSTEAWFAVNINPRSDPSEVSYTVVPSFAYFEFIPLVRRQVEEDQIHLGISTAAAYEEKEPVTLTEIKVGHEYEMVITTYGGLYRYRMGDIVRVTGFLNASPQIAYVCRKNVLLTINIDKTTEKDLQIVVQKAAKLLADSDVESVDFTSYADLSTTPGHYVIFWELNNSTTLDERTLQCCASTMDLSFADAGYVGSRRVRCIGPLELCIVNPGTFRSLLDRYLTKGPAITQYKTPRCISSDEVRRILRSSVRRSVFSLAYQ